MLEWLVSIVGIAQVVGYCRHRWGCDSCNDCEICGVSGCV